MPIEVDLACLLKAAQATGQAGCGNDVRGQIRQEKGVESHDVMGQRVRATQRSRQPRIERAGRACQGGCGKSAAVAHQGGEDRSSIQPAGQREEACRQIEVPDGGLECARLMVQECGPIQRLLRFGEAPGSPHRDGSVLVDPELVPAGSQLDVLEERSVLGRVSDSKQVEHTQLIEL